MSNVKTIIRRLIFGAFVSFSMLTTTLRAQTLDIYVNATTWAYDRHSVSGSSGAANVVNYAVTGTVPPYNTSETRYYYAGRFDVVVIRNKDTEAQITSLSSCNNICYIRGTSVYTLSNGFNGSGNGVNGTVATAAYTSNGDLYIGGSFSVAGGYSHTQYFSCYRFNEGWSGVNGIELNNTVTQFSWVNYKLKVDGTFTTAYGPITQGGAHTSLSASSTVYWNDYYKTLPNGWWSTN
ncbi:MAG TPA: hypothetical protein VF773_12300 [Verrucomicrobiae bacterium]